MTTDPDGPRRLPGTSVRTRLAAGVALLTGLALATAGVLVYALEVVRLDRELVERSAQQVAELRRLQEGNDPDTARPFGSVEALLETYLRRHVPDEDEMLVGWWGGQPRIRIAARESHEDLVHDPAFLAGVRRLSDTGGDTRVDTRWGEVALAVQPVRDGRVDGQLVLAYFVEATRAELDRLMRTYLVVSALLLGLITAAAAWQAGRLLSPLRTLRDAAQEISGSDLSRRIPERGNDDVTALTRTVNAMLGRLEGAFAGQRRFLDDAGHELRTPLTVLSGHLELLDPDDPREVAAARTLLLDEVERMSRLVDDLIVLARSARPDFLRVEPVDLDPFLRGVVEKCRGLGHRSWAVDEAADLVVGLDPQRVTQALLELSRNAVRHTVEGAEIGLGSRIVGDELHVWVRDTGEGVPDADKHRVFERFARGSTSPNDTGFGLGLSIVGAIARAHGGRVGVTDAPGGGAVVTLVLPLAGEERPWPGS